MKKKIALLISLFITVFGTFLFGIYDFRKWLDPAKSAKNREGEYKEYLVSETVDYGAPKKTEAKIDIYRKLENRKYSEKPFWERDVNKNGKTILKAVMYKNLCIYKKRNETEKNHYRYELFIYNVNYEGIKNLFENQNVPEDKSKITGYPEFRVNFYPNETDGEGLFEYTTEEPDYLMREAEGINLFDFESIPIEEEKPLKPPKVLTAVFYDYSAWVKATDENKKDYENARIKLETFMNGYKLEESLIDEKAEGFTLDREKIKEDEYLSGCESDNIRQKMNCISKSTAGVDSYDKWVFKKYLWWHVLIVFSAFGTVMATFYFTFTVEKKENDKRKDNPKRKERE